MFALMEAYYERVDRTRFDADLDRKAWAVLVQDRNRRVRGFTTLELMELTFEGVAVRAFYSGDTIVDSAFRGTFSLERAWVPFVFSAALSSPGFRWYWFTVCKGYRTFRYFPAHFHRYLPHPDGHEDPFERSLMDTLAHMKFGREYDAGRGVVEPVGDYVLRSGVADVSEQELKNRDIAFFVSRNPGWRKGDELACMARLHPENLRPLVRRLLRRVDTVAP
jgi:hypothetical protein